MSDFIKRKIADYIISALCACRDLDAVKIYIRGGSPMDVPSHLYPFAEVIVDEENVDEELTGGTYGQTYKGVITFSVEMTQAANGDWLEITGDRRATIPSYDAVEELVHYARGELQKAEHRAMGDLTVHQEKVHRFSLTSPIIYAIGQSARTNNWSNSGSISFEIETERIG